MANKKTKTVEVDGVEVSIDEAGLDDFEIVECIADSSDPGATDAQRLAATVRMFRLIFGADYARVKAELRAAHGGALTVETMTSFVAGVLGEVGAKN